MSESRRNPLVLIEEDPDLKPLAPVIRVLVSIPEGSRAELLRLADLWIRLGGVRRAALIHTLDHDLKVGQVALLAGVHRCTLSRNEQFKNLRRIIRSGRLEAFPRGSKSAEGHIDSFLDDDES